MSTDKWIILGVLYILMARAWIKVYHERKRQDKKYGKGWRKRLKEWEDNF